jgi:large subunit ribosomal protein L25
MIVNLTATPYETAKKGDVKRMRHEGRIPAILYGHGEKSRRIFVEQREFKKVLETLRQEAVTINLQIGDKGVLCLIKAIQHNPVTDELLHIDFQHIHKKEKIKATIPIHIVGEAPGVEKGGILDQHLHEIVVKCLPADMPARIDVDVSQLELGDTIHLYDISVPNTEFEITKETPVVSVLVPRAVVAEAKPVAAEEGEEGAEAEGEEAEAEGKEGVEKEGEKDKEAGKDKETEKGKESKK